MGFSILSNYMSGISTRQSVTEIIRYLIFTSFDPLGEFMNDIEVGSIVEHIGNGAHHTRS